MVIIKPAFKDYEYGFYGFHCSISAYWMNSGKVEVRNIIRQSGSHQYNYSDYRTFARATMKQLPKLKGVNFIYGHYKDVI